MYNEVAQGNQDAESLLVAWSGWCHTIDDAIDQDKVPEPEAIVVRMLHWTKVVAENPFFVKHRETITAYVISSANVFIDSVRWERCGDPRREQYADAYRSFWCELIYHIAYLVGGFSHMRAMAVKYRDAAWTVQHEPPTIPLLEPEVPPEPEPVKIRPKMLPHPVQTPEDWTRLEGFAKSFDHKIDRRFSYVVVKTAEERWIGFALMLCIPGAGCRGVPVAVTAWHPSSSGRECVEGMKLLTSWAMVSYGGAATLSSPDSPLFPYIEKLGYRAWNMSLFVTD